MQRNDYSDNREATGLRARIVSSISAIMNWYGALPEGARVTVGAVAMLAAIFLPIFVIVYHAEIWDAFVVLFKIVALLAILAMIAIAAVAVSRLWRARIEYAHQAMQAAAEAARREHDALQKARRLSIQAINEGAVKPLSDAGRLLLRNSESLWFRCPATTTGDRGATYNGELYVTSMRLVFLCAEYPIEIPISEINSLDPRAASLQIISKSARKTEEFNLADPEIAAAHVRRSVQAYHRQIDVGFERDRDRRIPQDVRTAVWQRDGGKCILCGATDYLEFDHIIPFSKGGANTVDNVQLLCRRCNLKKGADI